jgi:hypothetical protein
MNQRPAKTHRAAMATDGRISIYEVIEFMETAANVLARAEKEDSAFYFEQVAEHLRSNPKGFKENVGRVLGV